MPGAGPVPQAQGHRREVPPNAPGLVRPVQVQVVRSRARASSSSATRTGTRRPTRSARRCRTRSTSRSASTPNDDRQRADRRHGRPRHRPDRCAAGRAGEDPARPEAEGERGRPEHRLHPLLRDQPAGRAVRQHPLPQGRPVRDRQDALQTARGGTDAGGDIATNMLPPNIAGYDPSLDPFTGSSGNPDVDKAKAALAACGQPNGFKTIIATSQLGQGPDRCSGPAGVAEEGRHQRDDRLQ